MDVSSSNPSTSEDTSEGNKKPAQFDQLAGIRAGYVGVPQVETGFGIFCSAHRASAWDAQGTVSSRSVAGLSRCFGQPLLMLQRQFTLFFGAVKGDYLSKFRVLLKCADCSIIRAYSLSALRTSSINTSPSASEKTLPFFAPRCMWSGKSASV